MKTLFSIIFSFILSFSLVSCSSTPDNNRTEYEAYHWLDYAPICSQGIECIAVWVLVYGSVATVRYIKHGISSLTKFSDSVDNAIVIKCRIQNTSHDLTYPCGPYTLTLNEKATEKTRIYNFTGYDNQVRSIKGKSRLSVQITSCGLSQQVDDLKAGDVLQLEFPPECRR